MKINPILAIKQYGQSVWLDDIHRGLLNSGELEQMIGDDEICGVTSNPAILEKAIVEHSDYNEAISTLAARGASSVEIYEQLAVEDLRCAADLCARFMTRREGSMVSSASKYRPTLPTIRTPQSARQNVLMRRWTDLMS